MTQKGGIVTARDVGLVFPNGLQALAGVTCAVHAGELVSVVGPSGCGKSTWLRLLAGLLYPTQGVLQVGVPAVAPVAQEVQEVSVGFVFQDARLLPWRDVVANVRLPLELAGVPAAEQQALIADGLRRVGLAEWGHLYPAQLSGGMQMRVALVRALVSRPQLLLLDEPFGALDEITRQRLNEDLLELRRQRPWTGIFVTHNVFEAVFLSDRIFVMGPRPGRILTEIDVPFPAPRDPDLRGTAEFAHLAGEVSHWLRKAAA